MDDQNDDNQVQDYQDDLDTEGVDRVTHEATDDPTEELQVPAGELKEELDKLDGGAGDDQDNELVEEDMREHIEDLDENDKD